MFERAERMQQDNEERRRRLDARHEHIDADFGLDGRRGAPETRRTRRRVL
jgi:hypothetical protein